MPLEHDQPELGSESLKRFVLIGFMGAGKSTLGPILAEHLGWNFIDADRELEHNTGSTIATLFAKFGEPSFRRMEADTAARLLQRSEVVIALGGGAIETSENRALLASAPETCVVFLRAPLEVSIARCEQQAGAAERPILRDRDALRQRFLERLPHYESAHITIDTEALDPHAVAGKLLQQAGQLGWRLLLGQKATPA